MEDPQHDHRHFNHENNNIGRRKTRRSIGAIARCIVLCVSSLVCYMILLYLFIHQVIENKCRRSSRGAVINNNDSDIHKSSDTVTEKPSNVKPDILITIPSVDTAATTSVTAAPQPASASEPKATATAEPKPKTTATVVPIPKATAKAVPKPKPTTPNTTAALKAKPTTTSYASRDNRTYNNKNLSSSSGGGGYFSTGGHTSSSDPSYGGSDSYNGCEDSGGNEASNGYGDSGGCSGEGGDSGGGGYSGCD